MLRRKLAARDKTIAALIARAENSRSREGSSGALLDLDASLERLVALCARYGRVPAIDDAR